MRNWNFFFIEKRKVFLYFQLRVSCQCTKQSMFTKTCDYQWYGVMDRNGHLQYEHQYPNNLGVNNAAILLNSHVNQTTIITFGGKEFDSESIYFDHVMEINLTKTFQLSSHDFTTGPYWVCVFQLI